MFVKGHNTLYTLKDHFNLLPVSLALFLLKLKWLILNGKRQMSALYKSLSVVTSLFSVYSQSVSLSFPMFLYRKTERKLINT